MRLEDKIYLLNAFYIYMSGHSKWSTIKRQKGAADAKRGQVFTKLSFAITMAVKQGGGVTDPDSNFKLRLAVDKARAANMPKESIDRAIARASGKLAGEVEELMYEGFAPGGVALIVETVTDNKQRTFSEVKNIVEKNGGTLGSLGTVSYLFKKCGEIVVLKGERSSDDLLSLGLDAGVDDMEEEGEAIFFYTNPSALQETKNSLEKNGLKIESAELVFKPTTYIACDSDVSSKVTTIIEKLEELDDVQKVSTNLE